MNTLIFAGGLLLGALSAFVFMFITTAITTKNSQKQKQQEAVSKVLNDDLIKELFMIYMKDQKNDGK